MNTNTQVKINKDQDWYDKNAYRFENLIAIEKDFLNLSKSGQERLNRIKLCLLKNEVSFKNKDILEFGCGHGRLALEISGYKSYVGVDFSDNLISIGKKRLERAGLSDRAHLVTSDCLLFDGPKESYDIVCSLGMFSNINIDKREKILKKMCHHLKPGGTLFIDGYHASPLYNALRKWKWRRAEGNGTSYSKQLFSEKEIRSLFTTVGLSNTCILIREYPLLDKLYARKGWNWVLTFHNQLARIPWLNIFGTVFIAIGTKHE